MSATRTETIVIQREVMESKNQKKSLFCGLFKGKKVASGSPDPNPPHGSKTTYDDDKSCCCLPKKR